jgi:hypothetical protein
VIERLGLPGLLLVVLALIGCDPAAEITVQNGCDFPVWVRFANSTEGLATWKPVEVKVGETVTTKTVGTGGAASVSASADTVGRVFEAEDGDDVVLQGSLCSVE